MSVFVGTSQSRAGGITHFYTTEVAGIIDPNGNQLIPGVCQGEGFLGSHVFLIKLARDRKPKKKVV